MGPFVDEEESIAAQSIVCSVTTSVARFTARWLVTIRMYLGHNLLVKPKLRLAKYIDSDDTADIERF